MPSSSVLILIVEDDPLIQQDLESLLGEAGFAVVAASSAEAALDILARDSEVRAVVTDINLTPGKLKGWDVARLH